MNDYNKLVLELSDEARKHLKRQRRIKLARAIIVKVLVGAAAIVLADAFLSLFQ